MGLNLSIFPHLFRFLFNLALPPAFVIAVSHFIASRHEEIDVPIWMVVLAAGLSIPAAFTFRVLWTQLRVRREAAAMGAILTPVCRGKYPGNIDILTGMMEEFNNGYPGTYDCLWNEKLQPRRFTT